MPGIFISYRREDSSGYAGRLFDMFSHHFGREHTFMDLDTIRGGDDFTLVIEEKIAECDVLLAVIGPKWLTVAGAEGTRRLDQANDFVRLEIAKGLERGTRVIPILVGGAKMPLQSELPGNLRALSLRQAVELRDASFRTDAERLIRLLDRVNPQALRQFWTGKWKWLPWAAGVLLAIAVTPLILRMLPAKPAISARPTTAADTEGATTRSYAPPASTVVGPPSTPQPSVPRKAVSIAGKWIGTVTYDWRNAVYEERFAFEVAGDEASGTASFVGVDQGIFDGKVEGSRVTFMTKTQTMRGMDNTLHVDKHYYKGTLQGNRIGFSMLTDSDLESHVPVRFEVHRVQTK